MFLTFPFHLEVAQKLFGAAVGLGTRKILRCSLKQRGVRATAVTYDRISYTDTLNVIPFDLEHAGEDMTRRGLELKYIPSSMELHINVRYSKLTAASRYW
jgi:hypothetical protein